MVTYTQRKTASFDENHSSSTFFYKMNDRAGGVEKALRVMKSAVGDGQVLVFVRDCAPVFVTDAEMES